VVYEKRMGHSASLLVEALFKYGYRSERSLMLATGLSASHVHYLLRRLQSQGVINGFSIYVDPELFNLNKAYVLYPYPPSPPPRLNVSFEVESIEGYTLFEVYYVHKDQLMKWIEEISNEISNKVPQLFFPNRRDPPACEGCIEAASDLLRGTELGVYNGTSFTDSRLLIKHLPHLIPTWIRIIPLADPLKGRIPVACFVLKGPMPSSVRRRMVLSLSEGGLNVGFFILDQGNAGTLISELRGAGGHIFHVYSYSVPKITRESLRGSGKRAAPR